MRGWMVGLVAVAVSVFGLGVAAIATFWESDAGTSLVDLDVGDCFDLPDDAAADGTIETVETVDCVVPHLAEVVLVGSLADGDEPYPPDDELFAIVDRACRNAELDIDEVDSASFGLLPIAPTVELWESFEGRFLCVAIPFGGDPVTGSVLTS